MTNNQIERNNIFTYARNKVSMELSKRLRTREIIQKRNALSFDENRKENNMVTDEERLIILNMINEGKITAEEGAKLIAAIEESETKKEEASPQRRKKARWLRIRVTDIKSGRSKANVNLPIGLVDAGLKIASNYAPEISSYNIMEYIREGAEGKIIDVTDDEDGEHVEIYID